MSENCSPAPVIDIGQTAIVVSDVASVKAFYGGIVGLEGVSDAGPDLSFLRAGETRIKLTTPQGPGELGKNSVLYSKVTDIVSSHAVMVARGAVDERAPAMVAPMSDHDLWTGFVREPDGNLVGLMEGVRPPISKVEGGQS
jgi:predicted enzyme related to lactoylglutathione lyase